MRGSALSRMTRPLTSWQALGLALLLGLSLGVSSHTSSSLPGPWRWLGNVGAVWLAVAFVAGHLTSDKKIAALSGAVALGVASIVHYVPFRMIHDGFSWHAFRWPVVLWLYVAVPLGAAFGSLGSLQRERASKTAVLGVGLLAAAFAAEAVVLFQTGHPKAIKVAVPAEALVALLLPLTLIARWKDKVATYVTAVFLLPVLALPLKAFMGVIQRVYPGV